ncbi:type VII toxin-antitoxin system MntA family adenylyltransferase antitoxin [Natronobeatus ordinarius]|uniref:type VII toxin-antitoxin system MntA family adenylyltransferase antitoxin n=1 Tax=Natronobeatus ordinarius TaxID=2963433 RepID=UPI0020CC74EF|nr:nucleotidyltransferase domain-containing protein [Natronobeatus ordinarius]
MSDVQSDATDLEAIRSVLADNDVRYAIVFGSVARGEDTATSDIDLCLRFSDDLSPRERFDRRNRIDSVVQRYATQFVDVSDLEAIPDDVALNALRDGVVIYGNETTKDTDEQHVNYSALLACSFPLSFAPLSHGRSKSFRTTPRLLPSRSSQ